MVSALILKLQTENNFYLITEGMRNSIWFVGDICSMLIYKEKLKGKIPLLMGMK